MLSSSLKRKTHSPVVSAQIRHFNNCDNMIKMIESQSPCQQSLMVVDLSNHSSEFPDREETWSLLNEYGYVRFRNAKFQNAKELKEKYGYLAGRYMNYYQGTNNRKDIGDGVLNVGTEPSYLNLQQHNEMSYSDSWPSIFMLGCISPPLENEGITTIANNRKVTKLLPNNMRNKFMEVGINYIRNFTDARNVDHQSIGYNHWQASFITNSREEVEKQCMGHALKYKWHNDGTLTTIYTRPAFIEHPKTKEIIFHNCAYSNHQWFNEWKPFCHLPNDKKPFYSSFGDESEFSEKDIQIMKQLYDENMIGESWKQGDILLLENHFMTHGRTPFTSNSNNRLLGVILGEKIIRKNKQQTNGISQCLVGN
jgi:alpha-ketoglutarate-dependent taurine dioxygenase